ncbi:MAG: copper homeostasis protein CutC [Fimbriimonadaceae bacterium]|nr:copper homeostasis protein CutC [Fimbriimonadaceae bacterium]
MAVLVEAVACRYGDVVQAAAGGAKRVELVNAIELGGLTPSFGTVARSLEVGLPIVAMLRPRPAGFCYDRGEYETMLTDAGAMLRMGIAGFVTGISTEDGRLDTLRMADLRQLAPDRQWVCHRAFDATPDPFEAMEALIAIGFTRILTSGQRPTAMEGMAVIAELVRRAAGRIEILAAGGIRPHNVADLVSATGVTQVHLAPYAFLPDPSTALRPEIKFGIPEIPREDTYRETDPDAIAAVVSAANAV